MEFIKETRPLSEIDADVVVLLVFQDEDIKQALAKADKNIPESFVGHITDECKYDNFSGKSGQMVLLSTQGNMAAKRLLLRGLGQAGDVAAANSATPIRRAAAASVRRIIASSSISSISVLPPEDNARTIQATVEAVLLGSYEFGKYKSKKDDKRGSNLARVFLPSQLEDRAFNDAVNRGRIIGDATIMARDMVAEPAGYMTPTRIAEHANQLASEEIACEILDRQQLDALKMGAFLGVAQGADEPPKFIILRYTHRQAKKTIGIAGKGITFDSGGLSIKTAQSMENMKYDMSGAAAVIGCMKAIAQLKPAINVLAVVPATENMPSGKALHPGDIVTAMNGKTIEVNNTDAEGRLVLADALCYLTREKPDEIIDLATLTGAVVTALGRAAAGIMGNNDTLVASIISSGWAAGERYWQLPLLEEYKDVLKSDVADLKNAGARGEAGSPAGGMFLQEFVDGVPWAHLDIAGPAWLDKDRDDMNKGGTGFGVRTLCYYILSRAEQP